MAGYSISIAADTRTFLTGVQKGIIDPLEDAAEIIEDIGSESGRDLDKLERAMKDAQDKTEEVKESFSQLQQQIRETGRKSKTDFADPMGRSTKEVTGQLDEVEREGKANAAELFSSFDGSFESIADAAQGTLGGLVGGLKGIPAIAVAAAGAAGLGLVTSALIEQQEQADEMKKRLISAYQEAAAEGRDYLNTAQIIAEAQDIFTSDEREGELARYKEEAKKLGVDINTYVAAMAGDYDALTFAISRAQEAEAERKQELLDDGASLAVIDGLISKESDLRRTLEGLGTQHITNRENAEDYRSFVDEMTRKERENIGRVRSAEQERFDALGRSYSEAAGRAPLSIPTQVQPPDFNALRRGWQGEFERRPLRVRGTIVNRLGQEVI
jgi:hypothetical protein